MIGPEHNAVILDWESRKKRNFLDLTPEEAIKEIKENIKFAIISILIAIVGLENFSFYIFDLVLFLQP